DPSWTHLGERGVRDVCTCPMWDRGLALHGTRQRSARRDDLYDRSRCRLVLSESRTEDNEGFFIPLTEDHGPGARSDGHPSASALATYPWTGLSTRPTVCSA